MLSAPKQRFTLFSNLQYVGLKPELNYADYNPPKGKLETHFVAGDPCNKLRNTRDKHALATGSPVIEP
jgi:hypothetical protein